MKTSTIVRFVLAALFATLACVGLLFSIPGVAVLGGVPWLLLMGRSELTKPISRKEWWLSWVAFGILLALIVTLDVLHVREPHGVVRIVLATGMWIAWMFAIYYRWQREKGKADT